MSAAKMTGKTEMVTIRFEHDLVKRLDALALELARPGLTMTRSDAVRVAVVAGLAALNADKEKPKRHK